MVVLDVAHVYRVFGGPAGVRTLLDRYTPTHGLSYNTIQMWGRRSSIPAKWVGAILYAVEAEGRTCREFLTDTDEFDEPPPLPPPAA